MTQWATSKRSRACLMVNANLAESEKELVQHGVVVGLAPAVESSQFEKYPFWDVGVLALTDEKLVYVGEQKHVGE